MAITFDQIKAFDNGARFYTADLHLHSFGGSSDVTDVGMTVEAIIDAAVANKISILAITDHNNDRNIATAVEYATKYAGQLLVLPGVEVTTSHGHLLVYFAPEKADRVRDLLATIRIVGERGGRDSHTTFSMADVIAEAERMGGLSVAAHIDRTHTGFEMLASGYPNWKGDIVRASGLYGLEFDEPTNLPWYSDEDDPTPQGAERKKLLVSRSAVPGLAPRSRLAAVQNSDSHSLAMFAQQSATRTLTRFKMNELSFEGFRTALIDPDARVRAIATIPPAIPRVLGMQVNGGFLDSCTFHFSKNLNCFIGGRGTGKSTAIKSLGYGLGINSDFEAHDNCPDNIVVYCEDADGVRYRYERISGHPPTVLAKEDQSIHDVPVDAFRVEFYGQGELTEVAKDPLKHPALLQDFLDRHIILADLKEREVAIIRELEENSAQLIPLEAAAAQMPGKKITLGDINKKLEVAEAGRLKEIVAFQTRLAAEKSLCEAILAVKKTYQAGIALSNFKRDYTALLSSAGALTGDSQCEAFLNSIKDALAAANTLLTAEEKVINEGIRKQAAELETAVSGLRARHREIEQQLAARITDFQRRGLSGDLRGLNELIRQRTVLQGEMAKIDAQAPQLNQLRTVRTELLERLAAVRLEEMDRRKGQLAVINKNLRQTIEDYAINLYYDPAGICDEFKALVAEVMRGTYFQDDTARELCAKITPSDLARCISTKDVAALAKVAGETWAPEIIKRFQTLSSFHALEVVNKPAKPIIKVLTRGPSPKPIPVNQLSDGQKHTILLTIAMLAESNLPLIIDQPEDDLDNAFIFKSVVSTLRAIKERRQIILVTHNANIAVLGDSELLFPMKRNGDKGEGFDRGSIDRNETRIAVQNILEGGELAFRRRKEIYGY